jgi:hypothetical protein
VAVVVVVVAVVVVAVVATLHPGQATHLEAIPHPGQATQNPTTFDPVPAKPTAEQLECTKLPRIRFLTLMGIGTNQLVKLMDRFTIILSQRITKVQQATTQQRF